MSTLRRVLGTREVPGLLATSLVGRLPTAMAALAVLLLVRGQGGSYTLAGGLAALFTAGTAVGQPTLARMVDRRGQVVVLVVAGAVSSVAFVGVALTGTHLPALCAVAAAVAGLATPPLEPCLRALWPQVVGDGPLLPPALSLDVGLQEIVFVVGPLLATGAVALAGHAGGVLACAVLGLAGTLGFGALRNPRAWRPHPVEGGHGSPLRLPALVRVFVATLGCGVPVGALAVVAAAYTQRHGGGSITGWVLAANALGALAAGLLGAARPRTFARAGVTGAGLALAAGYLPLALPVPVGAWLALAFVSGLALPPALTVVFGEVQARCPPNLRTEANAWVVTAFGVGAASAALVAGVLADHAGHSAVTVVVLLDSVVTVVLCLAARPGARHR